MIAISRTSHRAWPLALLLIVTLAWKIATLEHGFAVDQASVPVERQHIIDWLQRDRFSVFIPPDNGIATVGARRGNCDMTIVAVDARGFHRQLMNAMRPAGAELFFVYRGEIYAEQPVMRTLAGHHLWARARDVSIRIPRYLVLGVVRSGCSGLRMPWGEMGLIS